MKEWGYFLGCGTILIGNRHTVEARYSEGVKVPHMMCCHWKQTHQLRISCGAVYIITGQDNWTN